MAEQYEHYDDLWRLTRAGEAPEDELNNPQSLIAALHAARRGRMVRLESRGTSTTVAYVLPREVGALVLSASGKVFVANETERTPQWMSQLTDFVSPDNSLHIITGDMSADHALYLLNYHVLPHVQRPLPGGMPPLDVDKVNAAIREAVDYGIEADRVRNGHDAKAATLISSLDFDIQL